ncbi:MAG: hypothetical protein J2P17_25935 [Mycobacterium sp.]|nr:hypothetical protein [Mycobacterium sp.]
MNYGAVDLEQIAPLPQAYTVCWETCASWLALAERDSSMCTLHPSAQPGRGTPV